MLKEHEQKLAERSIPEAADAGKIVGLVNEAIRPLLNEIRSSISYYTNTQPDRKVTRLALIGGASGLEGLTQKLTASLQIPSFVAEEAELTEIAEELNDAGTGIFQIVPNTGYVPYIDQLPLMENPPSTRRALPGANPPAIRESGTRKISD